jgi:two-component system cell cycle response regulator DivK
MSAITYPDTTKNATILCIEDSPDNRLLVRRILEAEGYHNIEASDAGGALELIAVQTPDLILMDINMPDIDGYTLTARLRSMPQLHDVPILALTANVMKGDRERSLEAGCDGYIQKPIDVDNLPRQVHRFLQVRNDLAQQR